MTNEKLLETIKEFQKALDKVETNSTALKATNVDAIKNTVEELKKTYPNYEVLFDEVTRLLNDFNITYEKSDNKVNITTTKELNEELKKLFQRL